MIQRKSIKVYRIPVKLPTNIKMALKIQELEELTRDDDILEISEHYNMLARQTINRASYLSLSLKDPKGHKNWIHFERLYEIGKMKNWNMKLYIEVQFIRAKGWASKYPLPNMLYSVGALKYFTNHLSTMKQTYQRDTNAEKRKRGKQTRTVHQEVIESIISSIETLSRYTSGTIQEDKEQYKAMKIFSSWEEFSPYYLWSIPWFHDILADLQGKKVTECIDKFNLIRGNLTIQKVIQETVQQVENHYNIPLNLKL